MKGGRSVIPVIDKKTERSYTESTSLLKNKKNQEVIMKKYTKLISAVLAAGLLAGILVFPGAAWEDKVSPWAVEELREAVALGLKNENFCDRFTLLARRGNLFPASCGCLCRVHLFMNTLKGSRMKMGNTFHTSKI